MNDAPGGRQPAAAPLDATVDVSQPGASPRAASGSVDAPGPQSTPPAEPPAVPPPSDAQPAAVEPLSDPALLAPEPALANSPTVAPPGEGRTSLYEEFLLVVKEHRYRDAVKAELVRRGHSTESVQVLVNTLPRGPRTSPLRDTTIEANLDPSTNALAPSPFALFDLGLSGDRATVALYWLTFGLALSVVTTLVLLAGDLSFLDSTSGPWGRFALRVLPYFGYGLGVLASLRGCWGLMPYLLPRRAGSPPASPDSRPPGNDPR